MKDCAQGFVEVTSYVAAFEAADAMAKSADVVLKRVHKVDGPIVCIVCEGDVAACKAAVDAASSICAAKGTLRATNVIARPQEGDQLYECLDEINAKKAAKKKAKQEAQQAALRAQSAGQYETPAASAKATVSATAPKAAPQKSGGSKGKK